MPIRRGILRWMSAPATRLQLSRLLRRRAGSHLVDDSATPPLAFAIYTLSDPRDVRDVRYVGQTAAPRRRLLQHLNHARLWLPDDTPWWIRSPRLRPLYQWIRSLHGDGGRVPFMVVTRWCIDLPGARAMERALIHEHLAKGRPLFNVEYETQGGQLPLRFHDGHMP